MSELDHLLRTVRRQWRTLIAFESTARALIVCALAAVAVGLMDRWVRPSDGVLLAAAAAAALIAAACAARFAAPLRRRLEDRRIARFVEERFPELEDAVVSAVDVRDRAPTDAFAPLVMASAQRKLSGIDLSGVVGGRERRAAAWLAGASLVACLLAIAFAWPAIQRGFEAAYLRLLPAWVTMEVRPGDARVPAGKPFVITASVSGRTGTFGRIVPAVTVTLNGRSRTLSMQPAGAAFQARIPVVDQSFTYRVSAGPAASRAYSVTALYPPVVQRIELHYEFPSFSGLKPREERDGGDVYGPAGTRVRLVVHTDKPAESGRLAFSDGKANLALTRVGDRTLESTLTVDQESAYRVALADRDGLTSEGIEYFVRVMDDRPPDVHILRPAGDDQITPLQEVPIEARADDDYGIASFDLVYSVAGGPEKVVPFTKVSGTDLARIGSRVLEAEDLRVKPGDVIAYYARATDVARGKRSTLSRSEIFFLEVKPFNEEYTMAQSQAMAAATGTQLEGLIASQKEIISATWNLERRTAAGKSAADVKHVADAQEELKARAEQAAGAQRQRRRIGEQLQKPAPQRLPGAASPSSGDPVRDAVDAMARAVQQLQTLKTGDALPHEMAALNALLQAEAEIRQRQLVQSQNSSGSYGGGRSGQDLSNLFDRELKRQSKTNYENKAQIESTPEAQTGQSALDKIRDLARRQEELTRQQRDLARAGLSAEEMKRQLEKLTREQEALRRQLEEASKQGSRGSEGSQGSDRSGSQGSDRSGSQGSDGSVRDAIEQMRQSMQQLQRNDPGGAAASAQRAADDLRQTEQRLQSGSPDAQKRALGDLQLESQQIAEEQRRIANEAERLDREAGGSADARRRLAADKDRLADRVDAMRREAESLSRRNGAATKPEAAKTDPLGGAATDLASQKVSDKMRAGADGLRQQKPGTLAPPEQQLADALDRISRKLNSADAGGAKGDSARLADQLDQVRDARERLSRLEKQISDAQQKATQAAGARGAPSPDARSAKGEDGTGQGDPELKRLQQAYNQELQRTRDLIDRLQRGTPSSGANMSTPEQHEWSHSAPGTEAFKQDYAAWQSLAKDVDRSLERYESNVAGKLASSLAQDRLRAGGSERVPDAYQKRVSKYFESLAKKKSS